MQQIKSLIALLLVLAVGFYLYGIIQAGRYSIGSLGTLDNYWTTIVTVIGGTLATNFGAVLGVTINPPPMPAPAPAFLFLRSTFTTPQKNIPASGDTTGTGPQKIQIIACWFYVFSLVLAFVLWQIARGNGSTHIEDALPQLSYTLAGVLVGGMTVGLGK